MCTELIDEDDRGVQYVNGPYAHAECNLRAVLGGPDHLDGKCSCYGVESSSTLTYREEALEVWNRLEAGQLH